MWACPYRACVLDTGAPSALKGDLSFTSPHSCSCPYLVFVDRNVRHCEHPRIPQAQCICQCTNHRVRKGLYRMCQVAVYVLYVCVVSCRVVIDLLSPTDHS